jgi:Ca2+-binding RTX toxin-like protein
MRLFVAAKADYVNSGLGTSDQFDKFVDQINSNPLTASRLNDAFDLETLTSISFGPNATTYLAYYSANRSVGNYIADGSIVNRRVTGGTMVFTPNAFFGRSAIAALYTVSHEAAHAANAKRFNTELYLPELNAAHKKLTSAGNAAVDLTVHIDKLLDIQHLEEAQAVLRGFLDFAGDRASQGTPLTAADRIELANAGTSISYFLNRETGDFVPGIVVGSNGLPSLLESDLAVAATILRTNSQGWRDNALAGILSELGAHYTSNTILFNASELGIVSSAETFGQLATRLAPYIGFGVGRATFKDTSSNMTATFTSLTGKNANGSTVVVRDQNDAFVEKIISWHPGALGGGLGGYQEISVVLDGGNNVTAVIVRDGSELIQLDINELRDSGALDIIKNHAIATDKAVHDPNANEDSIPQLKIDPNAYGGDDIVTYLPEGLSRHVRSDGQFVETDSRGREARYIRDQEGKIIAYSVQDGRVDSAGNGTVTVVSTLNADGDVIATDIKINNNPIGIEFSDVGRALGQQLGYRIAGNNLALGIGASTLLQTLGDNLGDLLDGAVGNQSTTNSIGDAFSKFGPEFLTNLQAAGVGALSSFLTAELVNTLGIDGFAGEFANSAAGAIIGQIAQGIAAGTKIADVFAALDFAQVGNAIGGFIGSKLASELVEFDTIGGQIGSAVGSALGTIAALSGTVGLSSTLATAFGQLGFLGGPVGAAIGAFVGFIVGGLIGSVFGGTPRSGADAAWNEAQGRFDVANAYARKGGSKDAALSMAETVAQTFNAVLDATGGRLENPDAVTTGNYGMRKSDYVYRPSSTRDKDAITFRVSSNDKDGFAKITGYGIYQGLTDSDFEIVGGSNYVKRAVYATFEMGGVSATNFDAAVLMGNISSAQSYESYLANSAVINAIVAAERDSVFAVETAINLARAVELGLTKRHRSDWFGGFGALMTEAQSNSGHVAFGFDYDPFSDQVSRLITIGEFVMGDSIDIAGQTTIEAGDGNDVIILGMVTHNTDGFAVTGGAGYLANTANLKINGVASTGGALTIDVAATIDAGGGDDVVHASNLGDNVFGGDGNDTVYGGRLDDWLLGGAGNDTLDAGAVDPNALGGDGNYLNGGDGNDILRGREGSDWLDGGDGTDILTGGAGDDILAGGAGAGDNVKGGTGDDQYLVRRGDGEDLAEDEISGMPADVGAGDAVSQRFAGIAAGSIQKNWAGSSAAIQQQKLAGGEDAIVFGQGIDIGDIQLVRSTANGGGAGNDLIVRIMQTDPETGLESYSGTSLTVKDWFSSPFKRIEWLKFADGNEIRIGDITSFVVGGDGNDVLVGTQGNDFVYGGAGDDDLFLLGGDDIGNGGSGDDMVLGDSGRDLIIGGTGTDELIGGTGSDAISGDGGADDIYGGADRDILSGGRGDGDQVVGGGGDDTFKYSRGDGKDVYFDDFSNHWDVVWTASGAWNEAAGFVFNASTGEVTGPGGALIYGNLGTLDAPDYQWVGRFDYDSASQTLKMFNPPAGAATIVGNNGVDTIEFAPGINLQDVILRRVGNDLVMAVSNDNLEVSDISKVTDSVTIKDWYVAPGGIEKVAFYETGILDISATGTNLVAGTDGADGTAISPLAGTALADWMTGGGGDDVMAGGAGKDILAGNSGADTLRGEADDDVLYGGTGNDILDGGAGKDVLVGGNGIDTASYASSTGSTRIRLSFESNNTAHALGDEFHSIENIIGGSAADDIGGDAFENELDGAGGDDILIGGGSDDTYIWNVGSGADIIREGAFVVEEVVSAAGVLADGYTTSWTNTGISSGSGKFYWQLQVRNAANELVYDLANYSFAANTATPAPAAWNLAGWLGGFARTNGNQVTREKFETSISGGQNDVIEFGTGISLSNLTFIRANGGIADPAGADLIVRYNDSSTSQITIANHFTVFGGVETLQFQDGLAVSLASILSATSSSALTGTAGDDLIIGQTGELTDLLSGGAGNDVLSGNSGADQLYGDGGDDVIEGGAGADFIDGGVDAVNGNGDTVRYANSTAVSIDLRTTAPQSGGEAAGDTLTGIENVVGSRLGNDSIIGDAKNNRIDALDGDNNIQGNEGNDVLISGSGADSIDGGIGEDNISSGDGNDMIVGGEGNDVLFAGAGDDQLRGDAGNDRLLGGDGNDSVLDGGIGNDEIYGNAGYDTLIGGEGNDTLGGGTGNDSLQGGLGDDVYFVQANDGSDTIVDANGANVISFDTAITHDRIWMTRAGSDLRIGVIGENTVITVTEFFAGTTPSLVKSIRTSTHAIFLDHPDTLNLITAMTASSAATPDSVPATIANIQSRYWHAGGKAKPIAPTSVRAINADEDATIFVDGAYGIIDHDNNISSYALKSGSGPTKGTISGFNVATGAFNYTANANVNGTDNFFVIVTDADGNATEIPVAITISSTNDAPGSIDIKDGVTLSILENTAQSTLVVGTIIGEFVATDPEGDAFVFSLENHANLPFALSADGKLSISDPSNIDFEIAASHNLRVRVTDVHGATSFRDFIIDIQNRNESNGLPTSYTMSIGENASIGSVVGTVAATDIDTSGIASEQRYYFWDGNSTSEISADNLYSINAITGQITVNSALDFEGPHRLETYAVIARDNAGGAGYNQVVTNVTVGISDANEANSIPASYNMAVVENAAIGVIVGSVTAFDFDDANSVFAQQRYYFWEGNAASLISSDGRYSIDEITGQIATNSALNFEAGSPITTYQVIARDNAGNAGFNQVQSSVTIGITDVNEANALPSFYSMSINEGIGGGQTAGYVTATDIDGSGNFASQRYYFSYDGIVSDISKDTLFLIDPITGRIRSRYGMNFEASINSFSYSVVARDNNGQAGFNQAQSQVTIKITDINEAPFNLYWTPFVTGIDERDRVASGASKPAIELGAISVTDPDTAGSPFASYTYSVDDDRFEIIGNIMRLKQGASFDFEAGASVNITITGVDQSGNPFTISRLLNLAINDLDDILEGSADGDVLTGQNGRDIITGNGGNDAIAGLSGNDSLEGGDGDDEIDGDGGNDLILGQVGADTLRGGVGQDILRGGTENDFLFGDGDNDSLFGEEGSEGVRNAGTESWRGFAVAGLSGGAGDDMIDGGDGDDYLDGGLGADQLIGGAGFDGVDYTSSDAAVNVSLASGSASGGFAAGDSLSGIELVQGSNFGDTITGSASSDVIYGGIGNDVIYGGAGNDYLFGGEGNDTIDAQAGDDMLDGGAGDDILNGGVDNDVYVVTRSSGADTINNYDPTGDDVDVIGFNDIMGAINDQDLWFEKVGNDLKITVIGTGSSVQVTNWYSVTDPASRANHKIDFIIANTSYSRTINVEGLVNIMATKTKPTDIAQRDALMSDLSYKATWATHWNTNAAPVLGAILQQSTNEDVAKIINISATDDITPNTQIALSAQVISGTNIVNNAGINFGAADASGVRTMTINPIANASGTARIRLTATDAGGVSTVQEFDIVVNGVADTPTVMGFSSPGGTSGYSAGIALTLNVSFPDSDGSETQEIWITGVPSGVTLSAGNYDSASATWKLSSGQLPNLKIFAPAGWSENLNLSVSARAIENGQTAISSAVNTTVVINAPPTGATFSGSVNENTASGAIIATVAGSDPDAGDVLTYSLTNTAGGRFAISTTGVVSVANGTLLNFETATSHSITVRIADTRGEFIDRSFAIAVNNINEVNSIPASYSFGVAENVANGTLVGTVAATDQDSTSVAFGQQRYFFLNGTTASGTSSDGRYAINASTGQITTNAALNFEVGTPSVTYTVIARDNQGSAGYNQVQSSVTIGITNVNEANSLPSTHSFGVTENASLGTVVGMIAATDQDSVSVPFGQQRYFFLNGSATSGLSSDGRYAINAITGQITVNSPLNFEAGSPSVAYTVVARDNLAAAGYNQVQTGVTIGITNVNEANSLPSAYSFAVSENVALGALVGTVAATDQDSSTTALGQQRYYFWNGSSISGTSADGRYAINATTGQITVNSALNFEVGTPSVGYTVIARDNAGNAGYNQVQTGVTIGIQDVNEAHSLTARSGSIAEGNAPDIFYTQFDLQTMMLTDPEARGMQWTFADGTNVNGIWTLSPTGQLRLTSIGVDYEALTTRYETQIVYDWATGESYETQVAIRDYSLATQALQVRAFDGTHSVESTFTATVTDVNEGAYLASTKQYYINDDQGTGLFGSAIYAIDPDTGSSSVSFAIDYSTVTLTESNISAGSSSDVDNTGNPYVYLSNGNRLGFSIPGDGEWEGGIKNHPTLGGRQYYQLDYSFDLILTDSTGVQSRERINVTFRKHGTSGAPPIVLDLDGDGIELTDFEGSPVLFDMDLDGVRDQTGWVGSDDGLLALDRNSNGMIDNISEISFVADVDGAQSDLEGLRRYDSDNDGYFDRDDSQFSEFLIWKDVNQDGISQSNELKSLEYWGIRAINLSLTLTGQQPGSEGNVLFATSDYEKVDGTTASVGDVFFGFTPSNISGVAAPVILDFDGDSADLIKVTDSEIRFDMDGDGRRDRTGWIEAGDAFLALDRNGNGRIDDINEISFVGDTPGAKTDLEGLASFDSNGDGQLTSQDSHFAEFKLWFDSNSNGVTDAGELLSLAEAGVSGLSLRGTPVGTNDHSATPNIIYNRSQFTRLNGSTGTALDAGIAYQRLGLDGVTQTSISGQSGSVAGEDSNRTASILSSITMETRGFDRKSKKYLIDVRDGGLFVANRKANGTVDPRAGIVGGASILSFKNTHIGILSPVILDLDGDGLELKSRKKSKALFDMDGDGIADNTGWVGRGDGMLVIDRNNDGKITGASEISFLTEKTNAKSDLEALAVLDTNKDGKLTGSDTRFGELKVWIDSNQNGVSDDGELKTLAELAITEIGLAGRPNAQQVKVGDNVILATSTFKRTDGSIGSVGDVALAFDPSSKQAVSNDVTNELLAVLKTSRNRPISNAGLNLDLQLNGDLAEKMAPNSEHLMTSHPSKIATTVEAAGLDGRQERISEADEGSVQINTDRILALITQDMAAFGRKSGANDNLWRREDSARPAEFFA